MGQYINTVNRYAIQNSSKNSAEKWVQKVQSSFFPPSSLTHLFFLENFTLLPVSDGNAALKHAIGWGWKWTHKYLSY